MNPPDGALIRDLDAAPSGQSSLRRLGLALACVFFVLLLLWPLPRLKPEAHRLAAVMLAVATLWITEAMPLPMTALGGAAACVVLQVAPAKEVFAPFADPLMFLFIGSFILSQALFKHGLDRRVAYAVLAVPWIGARPVRLMAAFGAVTAAISAWISNTATTAMMFPIGLALVGLLFESERRAGRSPSRAYATGLMLMTAFAASVGGLTTPVGTPPNVIGIGFIRRLTGVELSFFEWSLLGAPAAALLVAFLIAFFARVCRAGVDRIEGAAEMVARERAKLGPWTAGQRSTAIAFAATVAMWVGPGLVALFAGEQSGLYKALQLSLPEGVAALAGALLLFLLPAEDGARAIAWDDAARIDWGVVMLYGGGFALGVQSFETGLAEATGRGLTGLLPVNGPFSLLVASTLVAVLLSETTSNTASANMIVPVVISIAAASKIDPLLPALGATMGASLGFMLPVSTPCNAIVYGSGLVPLRSMMRYGLALDVAGAVVVVAVVSLLGRFVH
jgi:sodium-dependent dicarboxylate transporter 2/3/5